jgi:hypothetical protein
MSRSLALLIELLLLVGVVLLALLLVLPQSPAEVPAAARAPQSEEAGEPETEPAAPEPTRAVAEIAALFGWSRPEAAPAHSAAPAPEPEPLDWLRPTGYVVGEDGVRYYVFKDTRANAVISLSLGVENKDWKLLEVTEDLFVLEHRGKSYLVGRE